MLGKTIPHATRLLVLVALLTLISMSIFAQSQATTGNIEGRVLDPNGAAVPNAQVTATNEATGLEKSVNTDADGNYSIILLPPGSYTVSTTSQGFAQRKVNNVVVTVGGRT